MIAALLPIGRHGRVRAARPEEVRGNLVAAMPEFIPIVARRGEGGAMGLLDLPGRNVG